MRKFNYVALLAAALSIFASCKKDAIFAEEEIAGNGPTSFVAYLDEDATKTTIDGLKVKWNDGDEIGVNGKIYVATVDAENPSKALFNLKEGQTAPSGSTFRAYYPTSTFVSTSYTQRYKLQGTQTYNGDDVSTINYMYAQTTDAPGAATLYFKNVCGLLKLQLKGDNENVKLIKVTAPSGNYLYGTISNLAYNTTSGAITYSSFTTSGRGTAVTLDCGKGVQLNTQEATDFYIALPEKSYTSLKIDITTDNGTKTINSTKACPIVKNTLFTLPEMVIDFKPLEFDATISVTDAAATSATEASATLNITPADNDVYYVYAVESPGYVSQFSTPLELAKADIDFWKDQGATSLQMLINAGLAVKGPFSKAQELKPNSQYVPYAYAVNADFNVSPAVIGEQFATPEYIRPGIDAKYEDYLGQWTFGTNLITIEQKVAGESYSVSGLLYQSYPTFGYDNAPVEAKFDDGYFTLAEQITGTEVSVGTYGACDIVLSGEFAQGTTKYKYFPFNGDTPMTLIAGAFDGNNTIKVEAQACPYGTFTGMCFAWVIKTGTNKGKGNYFTTMPFVDMVKYEEPTGPSPEGQWHCESVTDYWGEETYTDWTMTIEADGVGFKINNFDQGFDEFLETQVAGLRSQAPKAIWNSADKTLTVAAETETGISASANLYWTGLDADGINEVNIVLAFDFDNNTCAYTTPLWGAYLPDATDPGFYTLYNGPDMVFTKVAAAESSAKASNYVQLGGQIPYNRARAKKAPFGWNNRKAAFCTIAEGAVCPKETRSSSRLLK